MKQWTRIIQSKQNKDQDEQANDLSGLLTFIYDSMFDIYTPQNFDTVNEFLNTVSDYHSIADIARATMNEFNIDEEYEQLINDFVGDAFKVLEKSYNTYRLHMNNQEEVEENGEEWNDDWSLRDAEFPEEDENFSNNFDKLSDKYKKKLSKIFK